MLTSWKTSILGFALILIGIVGMKWGSLDTLIGEALIIAGLGFMAAKDNNVTGGTKEQ